MINFLSYYRTGASDQQQFDLAHGDALHVDTYIFAGGAQRQTVNDTAEAYNWYSYVSNVAANGLQQNQTIWNRNGGVEMKTWDMANGDALQVDTYTAADRSQRQTVYDTAGAYNWYQYVADVAANGLQADQTIYYRNGNTEVKTWDTAHGGALQSDLMATSTGAHITTWDTAGTAPWSSFVQDQNASGALLDQIYTSRDGSLTSRY